MKEPDRRRPRLLAVPILLTLIALTLVGCGGGGSGSSGGGGSASAAKPEAGGTLTVAQGEENSTLLPIASYTIPDIYVVSNITEPLWKENFDGKVVPWLVKKFKTSDSQKVWTLDLREGVKFSDGKPMTSADVLFTLEEARKSEAWEPLLAVIKSVKAPSPSTVVITFARPNPETPVLLSQWSFGIVPKDFGGLSESEFAQRPIGTGPFKVASWKKGEALTLEKNSSYWQPDLPYLEKVVFKNVPDATSRVSQLQGGELDVINNPSYAQVESLESGPETAVGDFPLGFVELLILNARFPLFENLKVREAVDLALDREGMVAAALRGKGEPAGSYLPAAVPEHDSSLKPTEQNITKAKELLAEAVAEGVNPSFTILEDNEDTFWVEATQIAQQNLEEAGFKVKIQKADYATVSEQMGTGEYDAGTSPNFVATGSAAEAFGFYNGFEAFWSGAPTDQTTKLLAKAQQTLDPEARGAIYDEMQGILAKEKFILPAVNTPYLWAFRSNVTGFYVGIDGIPFFAETGFTG